MIDTIKNREHLYEMLTKLDDISKMKVLLEKKNFRIDADGRFRRAYSSQWNTPWVHQHQEEQQQCELWHELFFSVYQMVPSYCQDCWKVVVFIPTVRDLFDLYELQKDLGHPCKCGIEYRATDERRYGGYFYNWGKEAGKACYAKVRSAVDSRLSPDIKVILKCACSEYEIACGPPAEWQVSDKQRELEAAFRRRVDTHSLIYRQYDYIKAYVMLRWIHHAAHIGDTTYREFTDGKPITPTMKTYRQETEDGKMAK